MSIASNVTLTTVEGTYVDFQGNPIAGQVKFSLSETLRNQIADQIIIPSTITLTLDATGSFSVQLPVTDDPDLTPEGFIYTYEEAFAGGRTFQIGFSLADVTQVPATYGLVASNYATYSAMMADRATYNHLKVGTILALPVFNIADYAPIPTFINYVNPVSGTVWASLVTRVTTQEGLVNTTNGTMAGVTTSQLQTYATQIQNYAVSAEASQAVAEAQLVSIQTESASRLDGLMMVGA